FTGAGTLKKDGSTKLTLSADNALNGNTNVAVNDGELELIGTNNFAGNIDLLTGDLIVANDNNFSGQLTGNGNLTLTNGTLELSNSNNNYSGKTTLNGGDLIATVNGALSPSSSYEVNNSAIFVNNTEQTIQNLSGTNGNINLGTGNLTVSDGGYFEGQFIGSGHLTHSGGELTLSGNNTNTATGTLYQTGGIMNLQNNWNGNYHQSAGTTLNLGTSAQIGGKADFSGKVNLTDTLKVNGNLTYTNTSDAFDLTGTKSVDVDGTFELASGTEMNFTLAENKIKADNVILDGTINITNIDAVSNGIINNVIVSNKPLNLSQITDLFTPVKKLLVSIKPVYNSNSNSIGIEKNSQTAEQYVSQNNFRNNQTQIAALLDGYAPAQQVLASLETREQLEEMIKPILVAEVTAETQNLPMNHPYLRVFNHVSNLPTRNINSNFNNINSGALFRGQSACSPVNCNLTNSKPEFWFEGYYRAENVSGDSNALGYKTSRGGMMVGVDRSFSSQLLTGLVFGYGNPHTYNSNAKTEADDYTFGAYSRLKIAGIFVNSFLAYGHQNYELRQYFNNSITRYNGNSFYASLEFLKQLNLHNGISVSPLAAIDFQKSWADGFNVHVAGLPLSIGKSDLEQTVLRIGVNSSYKNLRTRLQYGYQVAGDLYGSSRASIVGGNNSRVLTGVNLGRNTLNIGFGGDFKINKRTKLFADYDFDLGEHSNAHSGQFGLAINF
ncbi:MAG: autotransporter domain-containing protein, partial [Planctomycetaceae bacterium]|nr:autotransporter domain-containing protein [Planctomycetaceae bacterium]